MAIAAAISFSLPPQIRRFSVAIAAPFDQLLHFDSLHSNFSLENPNFRVSASSVGIGTPEKISTTLFLDRRETGFLHFVNYDGLGNDFILIDNGDSTEPRITPEQAMCGNGVRCFASFIAELENLQGKHSFTLHTVAGLIVPEIQDDGKSCTVDLSGGPLEIEWREEDNHVYMTGPSEVVSYGSLSL